MAYKEIGWANLHRHGEFSLFDGFGKQKRAVKYAAQLGQTALGVTDHGSVSGLVDHYFNCIDAGIKPILGCEVYFQPKFDSTKQSFHMCLFCKSAKGYENLMNIITEANEHNFFRTAKVTLELLRKYREGLICSTACIGGWPSQALMKDNYDLAVNRIKKLHNIFGEDFYIELMPYHVIDSKTKKDLQYNVDMQLLDIIDRFGFKGIITTDSHFIEPEDYETFQLLFKIAKKEIDNDYSQRYMPTELDVAKRFKKMYNRSPKEFLLNTKELVNKCNCELTIKENIPKIDWGIDSKIKLKQLVKEGLIKKGKYNKKNKKQCLFELDVIFSLGFEDYFLIVYDLINYAKKNGIAYGPGRGSVGGSQVAYAIGITQVDIFRFGTTFERFLRKDKKKMPDVDMDFCSNRRHEVLDYIFEKYKGKSAMVAVYGMYKVKNLVNDLAKVLNIDEDDRIEVSARLMEKYGEFKRGEMVEYDDLIQDSLVQRLEDDCNFATHFSKLYGQVRYIGKHASGAIVTDDNITKHCAIIKHAGKMQSCYDLEDLERLKLLKLDILGLSAVTVCDEIAKITGEEYHEEMLEDEPTIKEFGKANTCGVFQFEKQGAVKICKQIVPDCLQDVISVTALNRPGPLQMKMPEKFAESKFSHKDNNSITSKYLKDTYGCFVYQENVMKVCREMASLTFDEIDIVMKGYNTAIANRANVNEKLEVIEKQFIKTAKEKNPQIPKRELQKIISEMLGGYLLNKGHAAEYTILSVQEMYYKHYYPLEFWSVILKYETDEKKIAAYEAQAVKDGIIILPVHVNGPVDYSIVEWGGGKCIQRGLSTIKGVGPKAAIEIEAKGPYVDAADFRDRAQSRITNIRVLRVLEEAEALEFNNSKIIKKVKSQNSYLAGKIMQIR